MCLQKLSTVLELNSNSNDDASYEENCITFTVPA